jgi:TRAP transporter TAXI family solute receptor
LLLLLAAALVAAVAANFGIARDYGYLHASILTGSPGGYYHTLANQLAGRATRGNGKLAVVPTAGSVENVDRLTANQKRCAEMFAFVQDGTPIAADAKLELLGRLPEPESLLLLGRSNNGVHTFADLRGASVGIGPKGSGTANLMLQLFEDADLQQLGIQFVHHELAEQAALVARGELDLAAFVMQEDADFIRKIIREHDLDIVAPQDLQGLISRYPWLGVGRIAAGRYDLVRSIPSTEKQVAHLATLVVANSCARRADRFALLMLLGSELPGFVRSNPPNSLAPATVLPLAPEANQFFPSGEPGLADRYFPWLVNLLSPAYWIYLLMAVTFLNTAMTGYSQFRLWRLDSMREKLEAKVKQLLAPGNTQAQLRDLPVDCLTSAPQKRAALQAIHDQMLNLRARCQRQTNSIVTPMGNEMFYRYQQSLIDQAATMVDSLLHRTSTPAAKANRSSTGS